MTVSLPKGWVALNNIKAGDQVNVEVLSDGSLTIDPKTNRKREQSRCVVNVERSESAEHLTRKLIGAYLAGYNVIEVRSKERMGLESKHAVKDFARLVIGPEVIEETSNSVIMHDLSDPIELPQKKCVRRMHLIDESMHRDALMAYESGDVDLAHDVIDRDQDVDRLYWMTVKQYNLIQKDRGLAEKIGVDVYDSMSYMLVARMLERIGDHAEKIARHVNGPRTEEHTDTPIAEIKRISNDTMEILSSSIEAFFLKDLSSANIYIDRAEILVQDAERLMPKLQSHAGRNAITKTSILDSVIRTIMYSMDIAEIAINDAMRFEQTPKK